MFVKSLKTLILGLAIVSSQFAFAYTIGPNQVANVGSTGLYYSLSITSGANAGKSYSLAFNTAGTVQTGNLAGGTFDSLAFNIALSSATIHEYVNGVAVAKTGSLTGNFNLALGNVSFNQAANQAAALGGISSGSGTVSFSGTIDGQTVQLSAIPIGLNYMNFTGGAFGGGYDPTVNAFGGGVVNFGLSLDGTNSIAHAWTNGSGSILFNGASNGFLIGGDLHTSLSGSSEVPEPATMGLLFSGLIGGAAARRKKALIA